MAASGFALPEGALSIVYMDWGKLFAGLLNMLKAMAPMLGESLPFDVAKLPSGDVFTQYLKPTFYYSKAASGGLYRRNEASFGPEVMLGMIGSALIARRNVQHALEIEAQQEHAAPPQAGESGG